MNGNNALLDSNVIISLSRGDLNIEQLYNWYDWLAISIITYMEVLGFGFRNAAERRLVESMLGEFELLHLDMEVATIVITYRQRRRIKLPDAIILATASKHDYTLVTSNTRDFKAVDGKVKVVAPPA